MLVCRASRSRCRSPGQYLSGAQDVGGGWIPDLTWAATFVIKFCEANKKKEHEKWDLWLQRDLVFSPRGLNVDAENNQEDSGVHGVLFRPADAMEPTLALNRARAVDSNNASLRPLSDSLRCILVCVKSV